MSEKVRQVRPKGQLLLSSHDLAEWAKPKQPLCMSPSDTPAASANDGIPTTVLLNIIRYSSLRHAVRKEMWNVVAFHLDQLALG